MQKRDYTHATRNHQAKISPPTAEATVAAVKTIRVPSPQQNGPVKSIKTTHGIVYLETSPVTNKQHRVAKKAFHQRGNVPFGYRLEYRMNMSVDTEPRPTHYLEREWAELDEIAVKLFRRKYFKLSSQERSKVHEAKNKDQK